MAGERKGLLYEVIVGEALRLAFPFDEVLAQHRLPGVLVRSDFVVRGGDDGRPRLLVQVSHSRAETKQSQKFWRDVAELAQAAGAVEGPLGTAAVVFEHAALGALESAATALVDRRVVLADDPAVAPLVALGVEALGPAPLGRATPWEVLAARLPPEVVAAGEHAIRRLAAALGRTPDGRGGRGLGAALRPVGPLDEALTRPSRYYQGCADLLLVEAGQREPLLRAAAGDDVGGLDLPAWFGELVATPTLFGLRPRPGLAWLARHFEPEPLLGALAAEENPKTARWRAMLGFAEHLPAFAEALRPPTARTRSALDALLVAGFGAPAELARALLGLEGAQVSFHWPWTFLGALVRAVAGRKQAFGAARIAAVTGNRRLCVHNSRLTAYELGERELDPPDRIALAAWFAEVLAELGRVDPIEARHALRHGIFVDKLAPHGVHPIPALLRACAAAAGRPLRTEWRRTSLVPRGRGHAGRVRLLGDDARLYWWRSAHGGHQADKAKEVGARLIGLTTARDAESGALVRPAPERPLVLVVDGDFDPRHLRFFAAAGADRIVRPQGIARLFGSEGVS